MDSAGSSQRLVQFFERDLRHNDSEASVASEPKRGRHRVSRELDQEVFQFVVEERKGGRTPEQMLVELKALLARAAPEVPGSQRHALLATVTGRAITVFFDSKKADT